MIEWFQQNGIHITEEQSKKFEQFLELFLEKNTHINLSAIRDRNGVIYKHFIDSCMLQKFLPEIQKKIRNKSEKCTFLDLGTGGGFPGIPLAIIYPEHHFTLLDTRKKKCEAVSDFCKQLQLTNVSIAWWRAEDRKNWTYLSGNTQKHFDAVISRATAHISKLTSWSQSIGSKHLITYKTPSPEEHEYFPKNTQIFPYHLENQKRFIFSVPILRKNTN